MAVTVSTRTYAGGYVYTIKLPVSGDKVVFDLESAPRGGAYAPFGPGRGIGVTANRAPSSGNPAGAKVEVMHGKPAATADEIRIGVTFSGSSKHVLIDDPSVTQIEISATAANTANAFIVNSPIELQYATTDGT